MAYADGLGKVRKNTAGSPKRGAGKKKQPVQTHKTALMYVKFAVITVAFLLMLGYMGLKVLREKEENGDEYERRAIMQLINRKSGSDEQIRPNRGAIMDRNRQPVAYSTIVYTVFVDVRRLVERDEENIESTIQKVHEILKIPTETLRALLARDENGKLVRDTHYAVIAKQVPQSSKSKLDRAELYDVYTEDDSKRTYVNSTLAAHVIGFVRGDGSWGLENRYDKELSGIFGRSFRSYDTSGRSVVTERVEAEEGSTLITTIDLYIQQAAERIVAKYGTDYDARNASAIVMNPNTGEVLAMASYPSYNLNDPVNPAYITNPQIASSWANLDQQTLVNNFYTVWRNFNTAYTYEPGSTFKPITVAAALEEGIIKETDTFFCPGSKYVAGFTIGCSNKNGHGTLTLTQALARSCNIAMMDIAEKLGRDFFYKYQRDFGYGERTGIDLPGEESGILHTYSDLNAAQLATASFGQRFKCTPIQAITGFCALINGGYLYKPYIVSQVINSKNAVVSETKPTVTRRLISGETSDFIRTALVDTFVYGTGKNASIEGHLIGGKSGTAEQGLKTSEDYHEAASFVGYFPADDPKYVVLTIIYGPSGETPSASHMFKELVLDIIKYKRIQPSSSESSGGGFSVLDDYRGRQLWEVAQTLNRLDVNFDLVGNGGDVIEGQFPNPGERISESSTVFLTIKRVDESVALAEVPDVIGMTSKVAKATLTAAGFAPVTVYDNADNTNDESNIVYHQTPVAFISVTRGMEIKIRAK